MESESDNAPPAKKLCTEAPAVTTPPETETLAKTTDRNSKPETDELNGKNKVSEDDGIHPEKENKPGSKSEIEPVPNAEAPTEVSADPQKEEGSQNPATADKSPEGKAPKAKDNKATAGKAAVAQGQKKGGKQNGYEKNNRPSTIDHVDLSRVIQGIQVCDYEIEEMTISANQKVVEIERSLRESKKPVYYRRSDLIQHIPEFWLTTLINHHHISHFINEADEDCLQYLRKLHVEEFDDSVSGFKISFVFNANPYFENEVLCKEISYGVSGVLRSKATPIRWKPGHDLTRVTEASASSSKSMPRSFFHWFLQNSNPVQDKVAVFIRDDIWPNPLKYFQVHTEDSIMDESSEGIIVDSSGEEDDVMVLEDTRDEEYDDDEEEEEEDLDDEDIELLENEDELLDDEFDSEEEDLLMRGDDDEEIDDDELMLIESHGPPLRPQQQQQRNPVKKTVTKPLTKAIPPKAAPVKVSTASTEAQPTSTTSHLSPQKESADTVSKAPRDGGESRTEPDTNEDDTEKADAKKSCQDGVSEGDGGDVENEGEDKEDKKGAPCPSEEQAAAGTENTDVPGEGREVSREEEQTGKDETVKPQEPSSTVTVKS